MSSNPKFLLWCDLETTGLDPKESSILEIAIGVAKFDNPFNLLLPAMQRVIHHAYANARVDEIVVRMHTENGLWEECRTSSHRLPDVDNLLGSVLSALLSEGERAVIAGASAYFDLRFIQHHMPLLASKLNSHKVYDTSAFKLLAASLGRNEKNDYHLATELVQPSARAAHRALADMSYCIRDGNVVARWIATYAIVCADGRW